MIKVAGAAVVELEPDLRRLDDGHPGDPLDAKPINQGVEATDDAGAGGGDGDTRLLRLEDVSFRYPSRQRDAVQDVSLELRPGELVAIQGDSGAGKTTLVDVLIGLITPSAGRVERTAGGTVGYVAQDTFAWDDTVRFNVALDRSPAGDDVDAEVWASLESAQLADWVRALPDGLETRLGERGNRMSGGERQRLGVARAMFGHPSMLLLDEPTSALDSATSRSLMSTLVAIKERVGVMVVTHDPIVVEFADRTVTIDAARSGRQIV
jgi:ATP-binding cassette subfamily C protein